VPFSWTRLVVRRVTPFAFAAAILAAVLSVTAVAATQPSVALAVYLGVVVFASVLAGVAVATSEWVRESRSAASAAESRVEELAASERRLRATVESAGVGLGLATLDGSLVQLTERLASLLGVGREAGTLDGVVAEADRGAVAGAVEMLRNGDVTRWEAEVVARATATPVALQLLRVPNTAAGEPLVLVQASDLSARRKADSLQAAIGAVRHVIVGAATVEQAMPQVLRELCDRLGWAAGQYWALEPEGRSLRVRHSWTPADPMLEAFLHASRGVVVTEPTGLVGRAWKAGLVAAERDVQRVRDYKPATAARLAEIRSAVAFPTIQNGDVIGVVELVTREEHDAGEEELALYASAGVELGQFAYRAETAQALRRSEADHRAIFERSPIGIARIGTGGDLLEANAALLAMLGHDDEAMRTTAWPELLRAYDVAASRVHKPPFLAGPTDPSPIHIRAATESGTWLWLQLTATTIPDANGTPEHVLVMVEDVTAIRETSDRLTEALDAQREANSNLEKLDKTKSEFLSIVSHEFRTALTGIQGFSELIRDGGLEPDEVRAYGGYIFNDADRVNRLIGDMLDLDRMESGRMTMRTADVDINDIVMEAISRAAPSAVTVEFKSDLDPRLPIVSGDRDRLIQVLSNLVNNAVKYSPDGGTVTLSSRAEGRYALVSVSDTGIGIPADEIGHVFERFRRVRSGAAQSIPGTGLGLTIVKQIVEMHGGKIWVESAVGHGSSFHFTIPLAPESATALQPHHA